MPITNRQDLRITCDADGCDAEVVLHDGDIITAPFCTAPAVGPRLPHKWTAIMQGSIQLTYCPTHEVEVIIDRDKRQSI